MDGIIEKKTLAGVKLDRSRPLPPQIYAQVRSLILSGEFARDTKIPSTKELAKLWQVHEPTVQSGIAPLVKDGLLIRHRRIGTFVQKREEKLTCVGIYDLAGSFRESLFEQALQAALKEELTAAGIEMDVWLDPRPVAERGTPWMPLVRAAEHREFQALIATSADWPRLSWQRRLPVPTAFFTVANLPNEVRSDLAQFVELSVRALAQQGCRSVGIISMLPIEATNLDGSRNFGAEFYGRLTDLISDLGLTVKNEWIRVPPTQPHIGGLAQESFGREQFLRLWAQPERPDGLIVFPDTAARGVILGLLERQVRVPEDLKLVLHKNEAIDLLCPLPATFVVSSERAFARALIAQVQKQFRGEACEPIKVPYRLMAHPAVERTHCGARPAAEPTRSGARHGNSQGRTNKQPNEEGSQL